MIPEMIMGVPTAAAIAGTIGLGVGVTNLCVSASIKNDVKKLMTSTDQIKKNMLTEQYLDKMTRDIKAGMQTDTSYLSKQIQCAALGIPVQPNYANGTITAVDPHQVRCEIGMAPQNQYQYPQYPSYNNNAYNGYNNGYGNGYNNGYGYNQPQLPTSLPTQQTQTNTGTADMSTILQIIQAMNKPQMPAIQPPAPVNVSLDNDQITAMITQVIGEMSANGSGTQTP